jgi:exodeoxyribonuclease VII large subunit
MSGAGFFDVRQKMMGATVKPQAAVEPITVTQLTAKIDRAIKAGIPTSVHVRGEVSNYKPHAASGHSYFTLKDATACISCVMWRSDAARLKFKPSDGMELLATGSVAVYPQQGKYQLYVSTLHPIGQGALELAFQQLKAKLEAEGLFAFERKKPLPMYPMRIALVTSRATAALQDMLKVLRRYVWLRMFLYHVPVQGDGSAEKIAAAIEHLGSRHADIGGVDVILLARGGGSLEDLWEFNEEAVARAIVASAIPVVTGIGHEVDTSIADLAADYHAHTPTEAAQIIVAQWRTAGDALDVSTLRLRRGLRTIVGQARQRLMGVQRHEMFRRPLDRVNQLRQLLDDRQRAMTLGVGERSRLQQRRLNQLSERLEQHRPEFHISRLRARVNELEKTLAEKARMRIRLLSERLHHIVVRLGECHPKHQIRLERQRLDSFEAGLRRDAGEEMRRRMLQLASLEAQLQALGPANVLRRGYSLTSLKKTGAVVRNAKQLKVGDRLVTRFGDGTAESVVEDSKQMPLFE